MDSAVMVSRKLSEPPDGQGRFHECVDEPTLEPDADKDPIGPPRAFWTGGSINIFFQKVRNLCLRNVGAIPEIPCGGEAGDRVVGARGEGWAGTRFVGGNARQLGRRLSARACRRGTATHA